MKKQTNTVWYLSSSYEAKRTPISTNLIGFKIVSTTTTTTVDYEKRADIIPIVVTDHLVAGKRIKSTNHT